MNIIKTPSEYFSNSVSYNVNKEVIEKWNLVYNQWKENTISIEDVYCQYLYLHNKIERKNKIENSDDILFVNNSDLKLWTKHILSNKYSHNHKKETNFYLLNEIIHLEHSIQHHSLIKEIIMENENSDILTNGILPFFINLPYNEKHLNTIADNLYSIKTKFNWLDNPEIITPFFNLINKSHKFFILEKINQYHTNNNDNFDWNKLVELSGSKILLLDHIFHKSMLSGAYFDYYDEINKIRKNKLTNEQEIIHFKTLMSLCPIKNENNLIEKLGNNKELRKISLKEIFFNKELEKRLYSRGLWQTSQHFKNNPSINSIIAGNIHSSKPSKSSLNRIIKQLELSDKKIECKNYYNILENCFNSLYYTNSFLFLNVELSSNSFQYSNDKQINKSKSIFDDIIKTNNISLVNDNQTYSIIKYLFENNSIENWLSITKNKNTHLEFFIEKIIFPNNVKNQTLERELSHCFSRNVHELPSFNEFSKLTDDEANNFYSIIDNLLSKRLKELNTNNKIPAIALVLIQKIFLSLPNTKSDIMINIISQFKECRKHITNFYYDNELVKQLEIDDNLIDSKIVNNLITKSDKKSKKIKF